MSPTSSAVDRSPGAAGQQRAGSASAETFTLWVDGQAIQARLGSTLLEAARTAGIHIPTLCHHEALESNGACRLCVVDISRQEWGDECRMVAACLCWRGGAGGSFPAD